MSLDDVEEYLTGARRPTAVHEAGHAVMAHALGAQVWRVWIARDGTGGGSEDSQNLSDHDTLAVRLARTR